MVVDTGSANTWVGAKNNYVETSTSVNTGKEVRIPSPYAGAAVVGTQYIDVVDLGNHLIIIDQAIGVATNSPHISGADGVLGLGPVHLTLGTLPYEPMTTIPTVTQNLYTHRTISQQVVGISFKPISSTDMMYGQLTLGGIVDSARTIAYT